MSAHPNTPHDSLIKTLLEVPERASVVLRESLPASLLDKLSDDNPQHLPGSFIDPNLQPSHSDRLFQARLRDGRAAYVYVLIEHKSTPDASTPVQLLGYMQRIWQRHAEHTPQQRAHRYRHLPPIIPLVLYNGRPDWSVPLSLLECIDADEDLRDLQRNFGYQVRHLRPDDRSEPYSEDPVIRAVFRALALAFADDLSRDDLVRILRDLPPGHPLEKPLLVYIARVYGNIAEADVRHALEQTRPERAEELAMTVAEEWIERGKKEGRQEGRKEAEVAMLLRQIERKFGAQAKQVWRSRIEHATTGQLEMWLDRILDADRVEDVFADN